MKTDYNQPEDDFGDATARMTRAVFAPGAKRAVLLMRHSAREYRRDIHDLENPLTEEGRALAARFGAAADVNLRGYSSPVTLPRYRCIGHCRLNSLEARWCDCKSARYRSLWRVLRA